MTKINFERPYYYPQYIYIDINMVRKPWEALRALMYDKKRLIEAIEAAPTRLLQWRASKSSGPGGQNVNKRSSKAHLHIADWKPIFKDDFCQESHKISKVLECKVDVVCQEQKNFVKNKQLCIERAAHQIQTTLKQCIPAAEPSPEQASKVAKLATAWKQEKRQMKQARSDKKASRRINSRHD